MRKNRIAIRKKGSGLERKIGICLVCWKVGVNTMNDVEFVCDSCTKSRQEPCLQCGKKGKYLSEGLCPDCQEY